MATVYEYKGASYELPDGLSNEVALAKIKASLGEGQPTAQPTGQLTPQPISFAEAPKEQGLGDLLRRQLGLATRAVVTGVSAPANIVTDFLSGAVNVGANIVGSEKRMPYLSREQSKGLTQLGFHDCFNSNINSTRTRNHIFWRQSCNVFINAINHFTCKSTNVLIWIAF